MKTLYIDVYFLINFTVDILALYFAAVFAKVPTTARRLILASLVGAISAVLVLFLPEIPILKLIASGISLFLIAFIAVKRVSIRRRFKYAISFLIFEALIGAGTYYLWGAFDKYLYDKLSDSEGGAVNRKILLFSLIVLLSIGVFKMIVSFFSNIESEGSVDLEIGFLDKRVKTEAFVDSGNLAIDPMDMRPILLIKEAVAREILPENVIHLGDPDGIERDIRKRIRLIPISRGGATHVLTGIRADYVKVVRDGRSEEVSVTIAIDKEGGDYGGYDALMPSAALGNVVK